jgi:dynein heavy chain
MVAVQVGYDFEMLDVDHEQYAKAPEEGVYVYGMFLEGCGWDRGAKQLCESQPKVSTRTQGSL